MRTFKIVQKRLYDTLSHRHSVLLCFMGFVLILVSAFHFGETALEWSTEKYQAVFNSYRDNIAQRSFQRSCLAAMKTMHLEGGRLQNEEVSPAADIHLCLTFGCGSQMVLRLCQYVPIDAVYTWVNGTDPKLLSELFKTRHQLAKELNISTIRDPQCTYSHCVQSHFVLVQPVLPRTVTLDDLEDACPLLSNLTSIFAIQSTKKDRLQNFTVLVLESTDAAKNAASQGFFKLGGTNYSMSMAYVTDEWMAHSAVLLNDLFILSGVPPGHSKEELIQRLDKSVKNVFLHLEKNMAVVSIKGSEHSHNFSSLNLTIDRKVLKILPAYLVLEPLSKDEDASMSRFADNEELKYSLRSLEKNAPWIRHVYLVTNGQIPSWLNLDNPRVTIVTHKELFPNTSHLPTFSSPAIECHLHQIPGLSDKFLYLNDDVFLGKEVWPEDFYSHSRGHKVYLSWPVPDCAEGCPTSWIRDGYCDRTCNNSGCDWDGGDCTGDKVKFSYPHPQIRHPKGSFMYAHQDLLEDIDKLYCNPSCANSWLADRYCDQACNVRSCGFDAGDCGTVSFHQLHQIRLEPGIDYYQLPEGELAAYVDLTLEPFGPNNTVQSGSYEDLQAVRVMSVSIKFAILTVVLHQGSGPMNISISLAAEQKEVKFVLGFDTTSVSTSPAPTSAVTLEQELVPSTSAPAFPPVDSTFYPPEKWFPKILLDHGRQKEQRSITNNSEVNLSETNVKNPHNVITLYEPSIVTRKSLSKRHEVATLERIKRSVLGEKNLEMLPAPNPEEVQPEGTTRSRRSLRWIPDEPFTSLARTGFLPWEQDGFLDEVYQAEQNQLVASKYSLESFRGRHLLDTFGDSLRHVNRLYNGAFGYEARKVPAHMAHLVDVSLMNRLQTRFPEAFNATSSHKIRNAEDMQFAFSYYYYLMSEMEDVSAGEIFDLFDTDQSGSWSDREIRTLLTRINDLPLQMSNLAEFQQVLTNCSVHFDHSKAFQDISPPADERYADSTLPTVSKALIVSCGPIRTKLLERFGKRKRNKFELLGEDDVTFKMIHSNLSIVLSLLDEIRKTPKKFICLNDNIGHGTKDADIIKAVLKDFYESLFPSPSQFELPPEYRNRFLYMDDLERWRRYRALIRSAAILLILAFLLSALCAICRPKCFLHRGRRRTSLCRMNV